MTYSVELNASVAAEVRAFSAPLSYYWNVCLREISANPHARQAEFEERVVAIAPRPTRIRRFEIVEERSVSGETLYILIVDFFPYRVVYVVDDDALAVEVIFLRRPG